MLYTIESAYNCNLRITVQTGMLSDFNHYFEGLIPADFPSLSLL